MNQESVSEERIEEIFFAVYEFYKTQDEDGYNAFIASLPEEERHKFFRYMTNLKRLTETMSS